MIDLKIANSILNLLMEDDAILWEIIEEIEYISLIKNKHKIKNKINDILLRFYENDIVDFYIGYWGNDNTKKIDKSNIVTILTKDEYWEPPSINDECIYVSCDILGMQIYFNNSLIDFFI